MRSDFNEDKPPLLFRSTKISECQVALSGLAKFSNRTEHANGIYSVKFQSLFEFNSAWNSDNMFHNTQAPLYIRRRIKRGCCYSIGPLPYPRLFCFAAEEMPFLMCKRRKQKGFDLNSYQNRDAKRFECSKAKRDFSSWFISLFCN